VRQRVTHQLGIQVCVPNIDDYMHVPLVTATLAHKPRRPFRLIWPDPTAGQWSYHVVL